MNSSDKKCVWSILIAVTCFLFWTSFQLYFEYKLKEAENHARNYTYELQVRMKEAMVEESRLRAAELDLICSFTDRTGEVYLKKEC